MVKPTILDKMKTLFSGVVKPEDIEEIRKWAKLQDTPAPVTLKELKTKDGKTLTLDGELKEGAGVTIDGAAAPDADYIIVDADGKEGTVTVAGGKVTKIIVTEAAPAVAKMSAEIKDEFDKLNAQLATQSEAHATEIKALKTQVVTLSNHMVKMLSTPIIVNQNEIKIEKKLEEMSNYEKVRFNRGEKIYHNG